MTPNTAPNTASTGSGEAVQSVYLIAAGLYSENHFFSVALGGNKPPLPCY